MGISTAISIALSGLHNNQTESALVSKNIANAERPGYTVKRQVPSDSVIDQKVAGVRAVVQRQVNIEVIRQLNVSTSTASYLDTRASLLSQIDQMVGSTTASFSLAGLTEGFNQKLQSLAARADNQNAQIEAVKSAQDLAVALNQMTTDTQQLRTDMESGINAGVNEVNQILKNISEYNDRIIAERTAGIDTTDVQDARDYAIQNLSKWMDVRTYESKTGAMYIYTYSGATLVASEPTTLNFDQRGTLTPANLFNVDNSLRQVGTITAGSTSIGTIDLIATGSIRTGKFAAMLEMRDQLLVNLQNQLDDMAAAISDAMSSVDVPGTAVTSGAQAGFTVDVGQIQPGNHMAVTVQATAGSRPEPITFIRVDDPTKLPLANTATGTLGDRVVGINFSGGPASVATQIQTALGAQYTVSNPSGSVIQILDNGTGSAVKSAGVTYTAMNTQGGTSAMPVFTDGLGSKVYTGSLDGTTQRSGLAGRIMLNQAIAADPTLLIKYNTTTMAGDNKRPQDLAKSLGSRQFSFGQETGLVSDQGATTGTISSFINTTISFWGGLSENANGALDSQKVIQSNLEKRFADVSTVNVDQEMARLIQIQSSYAANARVFTVVKEMIDTLLRA